MLVSHGPSNLASPYAPTGLLESYEVPRNIWQEVESGAGVGDA
jgi:hypothetical protein